MPAFTTAGTASTGGSNDTPRATFTPRELAELTMAFYRRNYIEGLFLSSGCHRHARLRPANG